MSRTQIRYLDMKTITPNSVYLFLGRRKSGKTTNIISLLKHFKDAFKFGLIFCGSVATANQYAKHVPSKFIHSTFDTDMIGKLIQRQEAKKKKGLKAQNVFILADDCAFDAKSFKSKEVKALCFNGRHYNITFILSLQYALGIMPAIRGQIDFVFASREKNQAYRRRIYENYSICFTDFRSFDTVMRSCTENHETLVLCCASGTTSDKVEDNVFYYKSKYPLPKFRVNVTGKWWVITSKNCGPVRKVREVKMKVDLNNDDATEYDEDEEEERKRPRGLRYFS